MDEVTKAEIDRIHDEERRQNHRLDALEEKITTIQSITLQVQRLADSMQRMCLEQEKQGKRLEKLEARPADAWNTMQKTLFTTIISAIAGGLAVGLWQVVSMGMR